MEANIKTAVCTEYERLLTESHQALAEFNEYLEWDEELRNRQEKYDQAYRRLRNHVRDCELCQFVSRMRLGAAA
jgi:hypothetical protein